MFQVSKSEQSMAERCAKSAAFRWYFCVKEEVWMKNNGRKSRDPLRQGGVEDLCRNCYRGAFLSHSKYEYVSGLRAN